MALSPETIDFLKRTSLFSDVPDEVLQQIAQTGEEVSYEPGELLIRQDGLSDNLFVIMDGRVEIEILDVTKVGKRGPKSVLGELAMITQSPRNANCTAVTPVKAVQFNHHIFWEFVKKEPMLAIGLLTEVIYHLDETIDALYWMSKEVRELTAALDKLKK
jgi:CRP-like cAMP-binding protein